MHGLILLDKPAGISSATAVGKVKWLLPRGTRIGHAGTLDPFATGLQILMAGRATKQCEALVGRSQYCEPSPNHVMTVARFGRDAPAPYNAGPAGNRILRKDLFAVTTVTASPASGSSTAASDFTIPLMKGRNYFLLRRLHSLTGILFGLYIIVHLLVNATLIEGVRHEGASPIDGPTVFQQQVDKIHSLPFLVPVEWTLIYLPIIFHTIYGIWITITGQPNVGRYGYAKNWAYVAQRISAIILIFFILFHVLGMKGLFGTALTFDPTKATQTTANHMHASWLVGYVIYPIGILAATFHLANGFWTAGITWGLTISAGSQRRWGVVCCGIFLLTFISATTALVAALHETPNYNLPNVANVREPHG